MHGRLLISGGRFAGDGLGDTHAKGDGPRLWALEASRGADKRWRQGGVLLAMKVSGDGK